MTRRAGGGATIGEWTFYSEDRISVFCSLFFPCSFSCCLHGGEFLCAYTHQRYICYCKPNQTLLDKKIFNNRRSHKRESKPKTTGAIAHELVPCLRRLRAPRCGKLRARCCCCGLWVLAYCCSHMLLFKWLSGSTRACESGKQSCCAASVANAEFAGEFAASYKNPPCLQNHTCTTSGTASTTRR
jgi:hypothetical protein